jgi:DNA-binding transcriptional LysR family regulator
MKHRHLRRYFRHGTLTQLSVFEAVARHASFTRAAEELHFAQPTVSVQMKKLAGAIGLPLFELAGKRVQLTAAGRELHAACADIFLRIAALEERLARLRSGASGSLALAVTTAGGCFAPRLLAKFWRFHPGVEASLAVLNRQQLLRRLAANLDDFYVFSNPPEGAEVVSHPLLPDPVFVYARADHPLAARRRLEFRALASEPFLLREPGSGTRMVAEQVFAEHGARPPIRMELGSNAAIREAIRGGLGLSILSVHAIGPGSERDGVVALDVAGFPLPRWWHLVYLEGRRRSPVAQAFLDQVRQPGWLDDVGGTPDAGGGSVRARPRDHQLT